MYISAIYTMVDLESIVGFQWDRGNERKSVDKHQVSRVEAEFVFMNEPLLIVEDPGHSESEPRYHALGVSSGGRRLHVTFTLREQDTMIRVISARDMSRRERMHYERET